MTCHLGISFQNIKKKKGKIAYYVFELIAFVIPIIFKSEMRTKTITALLLLLLWTTVEGFVLQENHLSGQPTKNRGTKKVMRSVNGGVGFFDDLGDGVTD